MAQPSIDWGGGVTGRGLQGARSESVIFIRTTPATTTPYDTDDDDGNVVRDTWSVRNPSATVLSPDGRWSEATYRIKDRPRCGRSRTERAPEPSRPAEWQAVSSLSTRYAVGRSVDRTHACTDAPERSVARVRRFIKYVLRRNRPLSDIGSRPEFGSFCRIGIALICESDELDKRLQCHRKKMVPSVPSSCLCDVSRAATVTLVRGSFILPTVMKGDFISIHMAK